MGCAYCGMNDYYGPVDYEEIHEMTGMSIEEIDEAREESRAAGRDMAIQYKPEARGDSNSPPQPIITFLLSNQSNQDTS